MTKNKNIKSYTAEELREKRAQSRSDLSKVDATTDEELEQLLANDPEEKNLRPDWKKAKLI